MARSVQGLDGIAGGELDHLVWHGGEWRGRRGEEEGRRRKGLEGTSGIFCMHMTRCTCTVHDRSVIETRQRKATAPEDSSSGLKPATSCILHRCSATCSCATEVVQQCWAGQIFKVLCKGKGASSLSDRATLYTCTCMCAHMCIHVHAHGSWGCAYLVVA